MQYVIYDSLKKDIREGVVISNMAYATDYTLNENESWKNFTPVPDPEILEVMERWEAGQLRKEKEEAEANLRNPNPEMFEYFATQLAEKQSMIDDLIIWSV